MISISGIKYQKELEQLAYFNKDAVGILIGKKGKNLDKKIDQLIKKGYLETLKNGIYVSSTYVERVFRESYAEYIANILRNPSYISGEYVLAKEGLIPESVFSITSITIKTSRSFSNFLGNFLYRSIKSELFTGYQEVEWQDKTIYIATKAKALFDYLYLKKIDDPQRDVYDLRLNWDNLSKSDISEFGKYVKKLSGKKMSEIFKFIKKNYAER